MWGETMGASFSVFVITTGGRVTGFVVGLFRGLLPRANCGEVTNLATVPAGGFPS